MKYSNFKVSVLALALGLSTISISVNSQSFTARHAGKGFTALTNDFTSALSNPALLTKYDDDDDVFFSLNLGVLASDEFDVIDTADNIVDNIEELEDFGSTSLEDIGLTGLEDRVKLVEDVISDLEEIDGKPVIIRGGFNALIIVPNQYLSAGMFVNQYGRMGIIVDYDPNDEQVLRNAIVNELDTDDLSSEVIGVGYSIVEAGVMVGYDVLKHADYDVSVGGKVKFQRIDLFYKPVSIADFDDDEFDFDDAYTDTDSVNFDLGAYAAFGDERQWHAALVINNISSQDIALNVEGKGELNFELEMSSSVGLSYQAEWFSVSAEIDLIERESFQELNSPQYASLGGQIDLGEHMQFRLGTRIDMNDNEADIYTIGLGISPWDVVSFDIAAFAGENDNFGAALQIGIKI